MHGLIIKKAEITSIISSICSFEGNNWGKCADGVTGAVGCGPQETFRGCADVEIVPHPLLSALAGNSDDVLR